MPSLEAYQRPKCHLNFTLRLMLRILIHTTKIADVFICLHSFTAFRDFSMEITMIWRHTRIFYFTMCFFQHQDTTHLIITSIARLAYVQLYAIRYFCGWKCSCFENMPYRQIHKTPLFSLSLSLSHAFIHPTSLSFSLMHISSLIRMCKRNRIIVHVYKFEIVWMLKRMVYFHIAKCKIFNHKSHNSVIKTCHPKPLYIIWVQNIVCRPHCVWPGCKKSERKRADHLSTISVSFGVYKIDMHIERRTERERHIVDTHWISWNSFWYIQNPALNRTEIQSQISVVECSIQVGTRPLPPRTPGLL